MAGRSDQGGKNNRGKGNHPGRYTYLGATDHSSSSKANTSSLGNSGNKSGGSAGSGSNSGADFKCYGCGLTLAGRQAHSRKDCPLKDMKGWGLKAGLTLTPACITKLEEFEKKQS